MLSANNLDALWVWNHEFGDDAAFGNDAAALMRDFVQASAQ